MSILHSKVSEVSDPEVFRVLEEIAAVARLDLERFHHRPVLQFLQQSVYPNGAGEKAVPISRDDLDAIDPTDSLLLRTKIGKLGDGVHQLCADIASMGQMGVEEFSGTALYVFLTRMLIPKKSKKKATRWAQFR